MTRRSRLAATLASSHRAARTAAKRAKRTVRLLAPAKPAHLPPARRVPPGYCAQDDVYLGHAAAGVIRPPQDWDPIDLGTRCWVCGRTQVELNLAYAQGRL